MVLATFGTLVNAIQLRRTTNHFTGATVCTIHLADPDGDVETRGGLAALDRLVKAQGKAHVVKSSAGTLANPGGNNAKKRAAMIAELRALATGNHCVEVIVLGHTNVNHDIHYDFAAGGGVNTPLQSVYDDLRTIATVTKIHFLACFCNVADGGHGKLGICANSIVTPGCSPITMAEGWLVLPMINPFDMAFYQTNYEPLFHYNTVYNGNCKAVAQKYARFLPVITAAGGADAVATHINFISINAGVISNVQII